MSKLHFVGFNGYNQFPDKKENHSKIIKNWTPVVVNGTLLSCSHRNVLFQTEKLLTIYGIINNSKKTYNELEKPGKCAKFEICDEFLVASDGNNIWKYFFKDKNWIKSNFSFVCPEEKSLWEKGENFILKLSFQQNNSALILLLSDGSVWFLSGEDSLKLLYPNDVDKAVDVCSGLEHCLILTESGCVLSFGNGRGQLGHGDLDSTFEPIQIGVLEGLKVIKIASGGWHSCAVTDSGDLYAWGWNNYGQLAAFEDGKEIGLSAVPVLVDVGDEADVIVVDVACGRRHTVVVLENGDLYSSGWNKYKQLGIETICEKVSKFTKCPIKIGKNNHVTCGPWYTIFADNDSETKKKLK